MDDGQRLREQSAAGAQDYPRAFPEPVLRTRTQLQLIIRYPRDGAESAVYFAPDIRLKSIGVLDPIVRCDIDGPARTTWNPRKGVEMSTKDRSHGSGRASGRSAVQVAALGVGGTFLLAGIAGFIPGITTRLDELPFAGHGSRTMLFGLFAVSVLHNLVHLLSGLVGLLLARTARAARLYLFGGGIVYLILWLYGVFIDLGSPANFVPVNTADNWLHLGLGAGMLLVGTLTSLGSGGFPQPQAKKGPGLG